MYKHVFGPVPSRRLGISLGVDLVVSKSCNLNCIFCECGATKKIQLERQRFKDMNEILEEISTVLKDIKPDYITFSGSGEPTLSLDLGNISKAIKEDLKYEGKICLITNSLLLADENLMKELEYIDLIVPTLNTLTQDIFEKIVRPDYRTSVEEIRKGFINLNKSNYKGKIWIEIFILENVNDSDKNFVDIANFLKSENLMEFDTEFTDSVATTIFVNKEDQNRIEEGLIEFFNGKVQLSNQGIRQVEVPIIS